MTIHRWHDIRAGRERRLSATGGDAIGLRREIVYVPLADYRADPAVYERMANSGTSVRVIQPDGAIYCSISGDAPKQPEPASFCAPCLDAPEPRSQLTVRSVVTLVFSAALFFLVLGYATGCAPSLDGKHWSPSTATIVLPASAPPCASWAAAEAWSYLGGNVPASVSREPVAGLGDGMVLVDWRLPRDHPLTLATALPFGNAKTWAESRSITRALVQIQTCELRMWVHEFGHVRGLPNVQRPGYLMHRLYPDGGWDISRRERRVLSGRRSESGW